MLWLTVFSTVGIMIVGLGCSNDDSSGSDAGDAAIADAAPDGDADVIVVNPCEDATKVDLPADGQVAVYGRFNRDTHVVYAAESQPGGGLKSVDVYLFDLVLCEMTPVVEAENVQWGPFVYGDRVIWTDSRYNTGTVEDRRSEIFSYDIQTRQETRLTDSPETKAVSAYYGDYVVYILEENPSSGHFSLMLWNLQTDEKTRLADDTEGAEGVSISDRYVSWGAFGIQGKDVYYHDLETGITTHLPETGPGSQYSTSTDGDFLLFMTEDASGFYHIDQYRYSTGERQRLIDDGYDRMLPRVRGNLAIWTEYSYSMGWYSAGSPRDLAVYDLETGVRRRVTPESRSYSPGPVDSGWLVCGHWFYGTPEESLHALNLRRMGLIDEFNHVIPE